MCKKLFFGVLVLGILGAAQVQAAELTWIKAAYSDTRYASAWAGAGGATATALASNGYEILDADQLKTWMTARIADKKLSVVVMTQDAVPDTVTETMSATCTLRKYLDAGGKIVWYADIPFYYQSNAQAANTTWGDNGAPAILGFNTSSAPRDSGNTATITPAGARWGLTQTWTTQRPLSPNVTTNVTILATDNAGNAPAWAKHYLAGDTFRGFVRFRDTGGQANVDDIMRVAEYMNIKASNPSPADGSTSVSMPLLTWSPGGFAVFHNVYFGTTAQLTEANLVSARQFPLMYYYALGLQAGTTYYWRIDEVEADGTIRTGDVWKFTATPKTAWAPKPGDGGAYVAPDVVLEWSAGMNTVSHDVYFGTDAAAVAAGAAATLKTSKQPLTSYTPGALERAKTYFWRVDENLMTGGKEPGPVWSFTVRPILPKADASLVGWWKMEDEKSGLAVDYSGYDNYGTLQGGPTFAEGYLGDALSFDGTNDFVTCGNAASLTNVESVSVAAWVKTSAVGRDQKIASNQNNSTGGYKLGVYSANNLVEFEIRTAANAATLNRNVGGGTTLERDVWYHVVGVYEKGKAIRTYVNGNLDRELLTADVAGISDGALMFGRESYSNAYWWLGLMDDVRVYNKALTADEVQKVMQGDPSLAWNPQPKSGVNLDIRDVGTIEWSAGDTAAKHDVYIGKEKDAVKTADTSSALYKGQQTATSFSLTGVVEFGGGTYFWRIDEVEANGTVHKGIVWNFTVPGYLIVDEFEEYNDDDNRIYNTWIDGYADQSSGSTVGYMEAPFAERTIVHGGKQSMPMAYDNSASPYYSEAKREFSPLQNWTSNGVTDLTLFVRGYPTAAAVAVTETGGKINLTGAGADIWNNSDEFTYAYKTLTGDGTMTARVVSNGTGTDTWAKGGVMIRDSLNGGSTHAFMPITGGGGNGASFQNRVATNGASANVDSGSVIAPPYWVKMERMGDSLTGYISSNGTAWNMMGTTTIAMSTPVYIGLAVTSHVAGVNRTFQFDSISSTGGVSGAWQGAVINAPAHNSAQKLYVTVEDSTGKKATVTNADAVTTAAWTEVKIPLTSLTGVSLSKVKKLTVGVGDPAAPAADGTGVIYIDDIRVTKP